MSPPSPAPDPAVEARRRRVVAITGGVIGLVAAVLLGWWTLRNEAQRITASTVGYRIDSDTSVWVQFDVSRPTGLAVTCTVRAMDGHFTVVGSADVVVPPEGDRVVRLDTTLRTTSRAVTGLVQDCVRT